MRRARHLDRRDQRDSDQLQQRRIAKGFVLRVYNLRVLGCRVAGRHLGFRCSRPLGFSMPDPTGYNPWQTVSSSPRLYKV